MVIIAYNKEQYEKLCKEKRILSIQCGSYIMAYMYLSGLEVNVSMSQKKNHHVTIKGTKDGLLFMLDDTCSFTDLIDELKDKLSSKHYQEENGRSVQVSVAIGNRYLSVEQEEFLRDLIVNDRNLIVERIESNVLSKEEAEKLLQENQTVSIAKVIRSGQVLEITGDLLLLGDVNPGATVVATGNIYVLGSLRGIAHAGSEGNREAVIAASLMAPSQLRISNLIFHSPTRSEQVETEMECAYISEEEDQIVLGRVQQLQQLRPKLTKLYH